MHTLGARWCTMFAKNHGGGDSFPCPDCAAAWPPSLQPNKLPNGTETVWGVVDPQELFGPEGWCTAERPKLRCLCYLDGGHGAAPPGVRQAGVHLCVRVPQQRSLQRSLLSGMPADTCPPSTCVQAGEGSFVMSRKRW